MKTWQKPELEMLNLEATEHDWCGNSWDGGYIGDGVISGHLKWRCPPCPPCPNENPS